MAWALALFTIVFVVINWLNNRESGYVRNPFVAMFEEGGLIVSLVWLGLAAYGFALLHKTE